MMMDIIKKVEEHYRIKRYRINYIFTLLNSADREASILLENECCKHMAAMSDVCVTYNIIDAGRKKSGKEFSTSKIVGVVDICLQNEKASGVPAVELSKRIVANLFSVEITRQEVDMIETETRNRIP